MNETMFPKNITPKGKAMEELAVKFLIAVSQPAFSSRVKELTEQYGDATIYEVARYCQSNGLVANEKRVDFTLSYAKQLFITQHGQGGAITTLKGIDYINSHS